jgi:hypothetical protein
LQGILNFLSFHWEVAGPDGRVGSKPYHQREGTPKEKVEVIFRFSTNITSRVNIGGKSSTTKP